MPSKDTQFKKGKSGNPNGRKKGSRNKITEAWLKALGADFIPNKAQVFKDLRESDLSTYARLIAALVPKDWDVKNSGDVTVQIVKYADLDKEENQN